MSAASEAATMRLKMAISQVNKWTPENIEKLLKNGADPNVKEENQRRYTFILKVCDMYISTNGEIFDDTVAILRFIEIFASHPQFNPNIRSPSDGYALIHHLAKIKSPEPLRLFLSLMARRDQRQMIVEDVANLITGPTINYSESDHENIVISDSVQKTPLHIACPCPIKTSLLLNYQVRANPNVQDVNGETPMHWCIWDAYIYQSTYLSAAERSLAVNSCLETIEILLKSGASLNLQTNYSTHETPMIMAVRCALPEAFLHLLLHYGADPQSAVEYARRNNKTKAGKTISDWYYMRRETLRALDHASVPREMAAKILQTPPHVNLNTDQTKVLRSSGLS